MRWFIKSTIDLFFPPAKDSPRLTGWQYLAAFVGLILIIAFAWMISR